MTQWHPDCPDCGCALSRATREPMRCESCEISARYEKQLDALRERAERAERELHSERARLSIYISKLYSEAQVAPLRKVRDAAERVATNWRANSELRFSDVDDLCDALDAARGEVGE